MRMTGGYDRQSRNYFIGIGTMLFVPASGISFFRPLVGFIQLAGPGKTRDIYVIRLICFR